VVRNLAAQFLALAEKQKATVPLTVGHRLMGTSLLFTGDLAQGRTHLDRAFALYDPAEHRPLATRFGHETRVSILTYRSWALWMLGYPEAARRDAEQALRYAREIGQAATLMYTVGHAPLTHIFCGDYAAANAQADEVVALADERGTLFWKALGMLNHGCVLAQYGQASDAIGMITSGITAWRSMGGTGIFAVLLILFGKGPRGPWPIRRCLALHWRIDDGGANNQGNVVRSRHLPNGRRDHADFAGAGYGESARIFRARTLRCTLAASKIVGTPCRNEYGAPLARPWQAAAS
jgi:hypothetical protein